MSRFWLIGIFSIVAASPVAFATVTVEGTGSSTVYTMQSAYDHDNGGELVSLFALGDSIAAGTTRYSSTFVYNNVVCRVATTADANGVYLFREAQQAGGTWTRFYGFGITGPLGQYTRSTGEWSAPTVVETPPQPTPTPTPAPSPSPSPPPYESNEFTYFFPAEYEGSLFEIRDVQGNVVFSQVIPPGGEVSGIVLAESLDGYEVSLDGLSQGELSAFVPTTMEVERPGFRLSFDSTYSGGEFQIRRDSDQSVLFTAPTGSTIADITQGRVTVANGDSATVWTRVPAGDGLGGIWVPTDVQLSGNGTTQYSFLGGVALPDGVPESSPIPSPIPLPSPSPSPVPLDSPGPAVLGPGADETTVDDTAIDWAVPQDNLEDEIEAQNRNLLSAFGESFSNLNAIGTSFTQGMNMFSGTTIGGVGRDCTLVMGSTSITLNVPEAVRTGTAVVAYIISLMAVVSLVTKLFNAS